MEKLRHEEKWWASNHTVSTLYGEASTHTSLLPLHFTDEDAPSPALPGRQRPSQLRRQPPAGDTAALTQHAATAPEVNIQQLPLHAEGGHDHACERAAGAGEAEAVQIKRRYLLLAPEARAVAGHPGSGPFLRPQLGPQGDCGFRAESGPSKRRPRARRCRWSQGRPCPASTQAPRAWCRLPVCSQSSSPQGRTVLLKGQGGSPFTPHALLSHIPPRTAHGWQAKTWLLRTGPASQFLNNSICTGRKAPFLRGSVCGGDDDKEEQSGPATSQGRTEPLAPAAYIKALYKGGTPGRGQGRDPPPFPGGRRRGAAAARVRLGPARPGRPHTHPSRAAASARSPRPAEVPPRPGSESSGRGGNVNSHYNKKNKLNGPKKKQHNSLPPQRPSTGGAGPERPLASALGCPALRGCPGAGENAKKGARSQRNGVSGGAAGELSSAGEPLPTEGHADNPAAAGSSDVFWITGVKNPHATGQADGTAAVSSTYTINMLKNIPG